MLPKPGDYFERKYRIDRVIGKGAFAHVYRAVVDEIDRVVAIKVLEPQQSLDGLFYAEELKKRFLREAKLLSDLQEPHTIRMYDYGRSENGLLFMIFEFIDGAPLDELSPNVPVDPERTVYIIQQVLESLREAHLFGIIHRDIKPANIMLYTYLGDRNRVKLLDFGVAKDMDDPSMQLTNRGFRVGTIRYMSPEQLRGERLTASSDLYSLGLLFFELLSGRPVIESSDMNILAQFHLRDTPIDLPAALTLPHDVRDIVHKLLEKRIQNRYQRADEVLRDFQRIDFTNVGTGFDNFSDETVVHRPPFLLDD